MLSVNLIKDQRNSITVQIKQVYLKGIHVFINI